jgi:four helix bundle protein
MKNNLSDRFELWAVEVIRLISKLSKTYVGRHMGGQLFRAATSAGANYEEACGGESRADFIHKLQIVLKEMREALYWLRLIMKSGLLSETAIAHIYKEGDELAKIVAKSVVTAKRNHP